MTYPLGWSVIPRTIVRRERWPGGYKTKGTPLVSLGQEVLPDQPVLRIERGIGATGLSPAATGNTAPTVRDGVIPAAPPGTEIVPSGLYGKVVDITRRGGVVIESQAAIVQGIIGVGGQTAGILTIWQGAGQAIPQGAILVIPGPLNLALLRRTVSSGVTSIIASSISPRDLESFLGIDLIQLLDSNDFEQVQAHLPPVTVLFTEGLGNISMPVRMMNLLSQHQGSIALLAGITSVRQSIFPELVISLSTQEAHKQEKPVQPSTALTLGAQVRVCSGEHEGTIGEVDYFFTQQQTFASGVRARAVRLRLDNGGLLIAPVTLVERIG